MSAPSCRTLSAWLALITCALPAAATGAERSFAIGSFDTIRVEGPFDVRLTLAASPSARAEGASEATDRVDLRVEGTTLLIRAGNGMWGEHRAGEGIAAATAPVIRVSGAGIRRAVVIGGGMLGISGPLRGQRLDLSLTGSGSLSVPMVDADRVEVVLLGAGEVTLGGRAGRLRLVTSGPGQIDAAALIAGDLTIRLDGSGNTHAAARFTAEVTTTGLGAVTVDGSPACTVHAIAGGPVSCGESARARSATDQAR